jgi:hypothetical protein
MRTLMRNLFGVGTLGLSLVLGVAQAAPAEVAAAPVSQETGTQDLGVIGPYGSYEAARADALNLAAQGYNTEVYLAVDGYYYIRTF